MISKKLFVILIVFAGTTFFSNAQSFHNVFSGLTGADVEITGDNFKQHHLDFKNQWFSPLLIGLF